MDYPPVITERDKELREVNRKSDVACWHSHGNIIDNDDDNIAGGKLFFNLVQQSVAHLILVEAIANLILMQILRRYYKASALGE